MPVKGSARERLANHLRALPFTLSYIFGQKKRRAKNFQAGKFAVFPLYIFIHRPNRRSKLLTTL
jgi:hypothetical protein